MIPVYVDCSACDGDCFRFDGLQMVRCIVCDGLGRQWAPGAPAYGRTITLADREPGEIVTLGNGQRAKILWHMPRKRPKQKPETTFLDILVEFQETETYVPVPYPSNIGVASVDTPRAAVDREAHERETDTSDPLQRRAGALL
jgi:hypothetical protein